MFALAMGSKVPEEVGWSLETQPRERERERGRERGAGRDDCSLEPELRPHPLREAQGGLTLQGSAWSSSEPRKGEGEDKIQDEPRLGLSYEEEEPFM